MVKKFEPNFQTPEADWSKEELNKQAAGDIGGNLHHDFRDDEHDDIPWETENLAKSHGIYLEYNRAVKGKHKDWMYMIRLGIPGGVQITPQQWAVLDQLARDYGRDPGGEPSIRLTTRQAVQYHWVKKEHVIPLVKTAAEQGLLSLNACGDNVRNIMACPLANFSGLFNGRDLAARISEYFQLPTAPFIKIFEIAPDALPEQRETFQYGPQLLNRKFKMAVSGAWRDGNRLIVDNCVELRTHDLGIAPIIENNAVNRYQIFVGGGQGEKNGKPTASMLSTPLAIVSEAQLLPTLDAVVAVHRDWGDRQNRHWARLKYVIKKQGVTWFREQVQERLNFTLSDPIQDLDIGPRHLHHGWTRQENNGLYSYGAYIENGRLTDASPNGRLRAMVSELSQRYQSPLLITPNQDILFSDISADRRDAFEADLAKYGYGQRNGLPYSPLRLQSGACVGRDTCRLAYTDSEKFEPELVDELERLGWGELVTSIGITGCERQCFRPATKAVGLVGSGSDRYQLKLGGTEDGRHQGQPVVHEGQVLLRSVPRDRVAPLLNTLFYFYTGERRSDETFGYFVRRIGIDRIVNHLRVHPQTIDLLEKGTPFAALT